MSKIVLKKGIKPQEVGFDVSEMNVNTAPLKTLEANELWQCSCGVKIGREDRICPKCRRMVVHLRPGFDYEPARSESDLLNMLGF